MTIDSMESPRETAPAAGAGWGATKRVGFRFVFSFFVLCLFTRVVIAQAEMEADFNPGAALVQGLYARFWAPMIVWTGRHLLCMHRPLAYEPEGNSDGIYGHVQTFAVAVLAALATTVWTLASRKPVSYARLLDWLRVALRYGLGFRMLTYGMVKVLRVQFSFPGLDILRVPYGDFSPMTVLWTFM
ncbi:MAG: hypothetical protein ACREIC_31340 [Limisphaerales bacterium]